MTLIEVMLSIGIVIMISVIGFASVEDAIELNQVLATGDSTARGARVTLGRLRRDLQLAYLSPYQLNTQNMQTLMVGQDDDPDTLFFTTLAHQRLYKNTQECDQTEVTVWAERGRREHGHGYILYHREAERIDQFPDEGGRIWPLAYNVRSFNARYLDGQRFEWVDEWDSRGVETANRLPRAVQLGLVLLGVDPDDEDDVIEVPFLTTVALEYAAPVVSQNMLDMGAAGATAAPLGGP
jgi:general secretion pathway protein J